MVADAAIASKLDPTGTFDIRTKFRAQMDARWSALRRLVIEAIDRNDALGLNSDRSKFGTHTAQFRQLPLPGADKVKTFQMWIDQAMATVILGYDGSWMTPFFRTAADRAQARAGKLLGRIVGRDGEQVDAITSLAVVELQGVIEAVSQKAVRALADGHIAKQRASKVARDVAAFITVTGRKRGRDLANTMTVKMFSVATIDAFKAAGVKQVGTTPERIRVVHGPHGIARAKDAAPGLTRVGRCMIGDEKSKRKAPSARKQREIEKQAEELAKLDEVDILTAGDDDVCDECEGISNDGPYDINEALSLIPAHPNCRCAFIPVSDERFAEVSKDE